MDYIFQLDQTEELLQNCYSYPFQFQICKTTEELEVQQPACTTHEDDGSAGKPSSFDSCLRRKSSSSLSFNEFESTNPSEPKKRKIMHRDVERQRRQEMATLYTSLRSLLPIEYVKGKRSISDHTHQAVNYIKHLQRKVEELNNKRDELQKLCNPSSHCKGAIENSQVAKHDIVIVRPCLVGVEVVISTALEEALPLSRVLQALIR